MNKMNGGYVMVAYNASQSELAKAYATKRPVIVYDADNIGHYAEICVDANDAYYLKTLKGALVRHNIELAKGTAYKISIIVYAQETTAFNTFNAVKGAIDTNGCTIPSQSFIINSSAHDVIFGAGWDYSTLYWIEPTEDGWEVNTTDFDNWPDDMVVQDSVIL